jgi:hypothetical protein
MGKRFLIGQLACFGDCLYITTLVKQIKTDFPDSHITWAVSSKYKTILLLNPYIDEIWEIDIQNNDFYKAGWKTFEAEAKRRQAKGIYDELIFTQISPNWNYYDGTIRTSELNGYKRPITISNNPVVKLSEREVERVKAFAIENKLSSYKDVILFEYAPGSGQSFVNLEFAITVAENITNEFNNVCFILSSPKALNHPNALITDASSLTYRENAELTKYCTLLIGCSSGITWLATSDWAKQLHTVQLLNRDAPYFAGVKYDFDYWNASTSHIIEVTLNSTDYVTGCLKAILNEGFDAAKQQYDEDYKPDYKNFRVTVQFAIWENDSEHLNNIL